MKFLYYKAINWDEIEDDLDKYAWEQMTSNFWLDTRVPVTNDTESWNQLCVAEKQQLRHLLASISLLSVMQSEFGAPALRGDKRTQQEEAVLNTVTFMKSVHAKSCTTIFRTLLAPEQANEAFAFADQELTLQKEAACLIKLFQKGTPLQKKAAFILTEISLTVGKYAAILEKTKLTNLNHLINNILQGSAIYCAYLGYKFRLGFSELTPEQQEQLQNWTTVFFGHLIVNETDFFKTTGTGEAALNLCYWGTNYSLKLLGMKPTYAVEQTPLVGKLEQIFIDQDKFSQQAAAANSEVDTEEMTDEDYDF